MKRRIWHYEKANTDPWDKIFSNTDVNQYLHLINQTIKNIFCNFTPHETVTCDDRDSPWINSKIKYLMQEMNIAQKCYLQNNKDIKLFRRFQCMQNLLTAANEKSKEQFCSQFLTKLKYPTISPKAYWSILKTFLNNKKNTLYSTNLS